jgi:hypothetical protein
MFKLDNITGGIWRPHFYDEDLFDRMFLLDNIAGGIWKPDLFDRAQFEWMLKVDNDTASLDTNQESCLQHQWRIREGEED